MTEAIFAVTPSETIKCDLRNYIDTRNSVSCTGQS